MNLVRRRGLLYGLQRESSTSILVNTRRRPTMDVRLIVVLILALMALAFLVAFFRWRCNHRIVVFDDVVSKAIITHMEATMRRAGLKGRVAILELRSRALPSSTRRGFYVKTKECIGGKTIVRAYNVVMEMDNGEPVSVRMESA